MKEMISNVKLNEVQACCCLEVGTVIDNQQRTITVGETFSDEVAARARLRYLLAQADVVASEAVTVTQSIMSSAPNSVALSVQITFCCEAERLIFELKLR